MHFKEIFDDMLNESLNSVDQLKQFFIKTGGTKGHWYHSFSGGNYPYLDGDTVEKFFPKVVQLEKMPNQIMAYMESDIDAEDKNILYFCVVYKEKFSDIESGKEAIIKIVTFTIDMGSPESKYADIGSEVFLHNPKNFKLKKKMEATFNSEDEYNNFLYDYMQVRGTTRRFRKHIKKVNRRLNPSSVKKFRL